MHKFEVIIYRSKQNDAFIVEGPKLNTLNVYEEASNEALKNALLLLTFG